MSFNVMKAENIEKQNLLINGDATLPNREATNAYTYGTINENNCGMVSQFETVSGATGKSCKIQYVKILIFCEKL